jgi:hypothetical protein
MVGALQWPDSAEILPSVLIQFCNKERHPSDPAGEPGRKWNRINTRHDLVGRTPVSYLDSFRRPIILTDVIVLSSVPTSIIDNVYQKLFPRTSFRILRVTVLHGVQSAVYLTYSTEHTI